MAIGLELIPDSLTSSSTSSSKTKEVTGKDELGKEDFLKLLVAQLEAQDPLSPLEGQEFTAQLAQFSSLEQIVQVNENLESLLDFETSLTNASTLNLIGKRIDADGDTIKLEEGDTPTLSYSLFDAATSIEVEVLDGDGKTVTTLTASNQDAGANSVVWNGRDGEGAVVPAGTYTFKVKATDKNDEEVEVDTFTSGLVKEVLFEDGISYAVVDGEKIAAGTITRVSSE